MKLVQNRFSFLRPDCNLIMMTIAVGLCLGWVHPPSRVTPAPYMTAILSEHIRPHSRLEFSPDGSEMYWSGYVIGEGNTEWIFFSTYREDRWTAPEKVPFNGGLGNGPALSPDGNRLYFGCERRLETDGAIYSGIWYVERTVEGWGEVGPVRSTLDATGFVGRPSLARSGNLYFVTRGALADVPSFFRCVLVDGAYLDPEPLLGAFTGEVVMDPWIDPDEEFLLFMCDDWANPRQSFGSSDLFISFRKEDDSWHEPINLGGRINTEHFDRSPSLSRDGNDLIFIRAEGEIYVESNSHFYHVRFLNQVLNLRQIK